MTLLATTLRDHAFQELRKYQSNEVRKTCIGDGWVWMDGWMDGCLVFVFVGR